MSEIRIALAGNPNCGKTTMFNNLTGSNQYVGNWPGVTVEKKEGKMKGMKDVVVTDLPGIYSLSPYTSEEVVSRDYLIKDNPDAILDLVDATNIERNLYLTTQLLELGKPTVIALNMIDVLKKSGDSVDTEKLQAELGCTVIETSALKGTGVKEAAAAAKKAAESGKAFIPTAVFSKDVEEYISKMEALVPSTVKSELKRWYAIKLLERDSVVLAQLALSSADSAKAEEISKALEKAKDDDVESIITNERYVYIQGIVSRCVRKSGQKMTRSDKIDRIVTNRWLGIPIFLAVMWVVYYIAVSSLGTVLTDWANDGLFGDGWNFLGIEGLAIPGISASVEEALTNAGANEVLIDCIVNGVIGGVGAVLGFVPQMAVLFLLLSLIEDCGYMVRIAFVMDRIFRKFGLSGKSFIPLLVGSGCGVPGIMASRTIENDNDRRLTIFTTTWVPCGAKLPVIALIAGVIGAKLTGWDGGSLTLLMYVIGIGAVVMAAIMLKKTKPFHGKAAPFVMELPQYHLPQLKTVLMHTWERLRGFIVKAGTILFVACLVIWFLSSYGFASPKDEVVENGEVVEEAVEGGFGLVDADESLLADVGNVIRYVFKPLGFGEKVGGWQSAAASLSGFSAKEAIVSTMGVLANVDEENVEDDAVVAEAIGGWFATALAAFAFLMFNLLDSPCLAAIATMANELKSRKWFWFAIIFQNVFAYVLTLIVYQLGMLFVHGHFGVGTVFAFVFLAGIIFALFRKDPYKGQYFDSKSAS
ncbi:ferrous iron transport protein B [uncultured Treponema sp.]|uniref:ferrous iron transport protein B n=1 Tax=uncultured Treponema sp. TaxID=162155 RepID=UPI0025D0EF1B|nr:ferrous iron transport protein B [uncultured Treponema sp.]